MSQPVVEELGDGRLLLDLGFRDHEGLISAYLLPGPDGWSLIETGPTTCRETLLSAIARAGVDTTEVRRVFVTHIHLDHAGGLGALVDALPRARFFAHTRGVRHLVDPSRLIDSARRAWGPAADPLWGPIPPVPADRLEALSGGERFDIAGGSLEVLATPGHASHHLSFLDTATRSILTGDSAGVHVAGLWRARPAIPPPDLDLDLLFESVERMSALEPRRLFYSHFGPAPDAVRTLAGYTVTVREWRDAALDAARSDPGVPAVARALRAFEENAAQAAGGPLGDERSALVSGYDLAAQGLLRYFRQHGLLAG